MILVLVRASLERTGAVCELGVAVSAVHRGKKLLPSWLLINNASTSVSVQTASRRRNPPSICCGIFGSGSR